MTIANLKCYACGLEWNRQRFLMLHPRCLHWYCQKHFGMHACAERLWIQSGRERWVVPYADNSSLPEPVRGTLPEHAQSIYRESFNSARSEYGETRAHKIAWGAVKNAGYRKREGKWDKAKESEG